MVSSSEAAVRAPKLKKQKGNRVEVNDGKYAGRRGWVNVAKGNKGFTEQKVHLILSFGKDEILCCLFQASVVILSSDAKFKERKDMNYVDVLLADHKDISALISKLARELARCQGLAPEHVYDINNVLNLRLQHALVAQHRRGHKASWRLVDFKQDPLSSRVAAPAFPTELDLMSTSVKSSVTGDAAGGSGSRNSKSKKKQKKTFASAAAGLKTTGL